MLTTESPASALRNVPLFSTLRDPDLEALAAGARERSYPKGSVIIFADDPGDSMFVVRKGSVKVSLIGEDGDEVILAVLQPGQHFGELALLDGERRSAHVIALTDVTLLVLRRDELLARLRSAPDLTLALLKAVSRRLRRADAAIGELALLEVSARLASLLLSLLDEHNGQPIPRRFTHQVMAQLIGTSRETVSRAMGDFVKLGVVKTSSDGIAIIDRAKLARLAHRG